MYFFSYPIQERILKTALENTSFTWIRQENAFINYNSSLQS